MINFPPVNSPAFAGRKVNKNKPRAYAVASEREGQKPVSSERRGNRNRRRNAQGDLIVDRRLSIDRRKGRVNLVV